MDRARFWRTMWHIACDDCKRFKSIAIVEGVIIVALAAALRCVM